MLFTNNLPHKNDRAFSQKTWATVAVLAMVTWVNWTCQSPSEKVEEKAAVQADFKSIFDGKSLEGWEFDPDYWTVKDGAIHGQTTAENP